MDRIISTAFYILGALIIVGLIWLVWDYFAV